MLDLIENIYFAANEWAGNIQNKIDARYQEKSMLTDLFIEHKYLGLVWTSFNLRNDRSNILFSSTGRRRSRKYIK